MTQKSAQIERSLTRAIAVAATPVIHEQHEDGETDQRHGKADDEDRIEPAWHRRQYPEREERADKHAYGVHRPVDAERRGQILRTSREGDHRVTWSRADALA